MMLNKYIKYLPWMILGALPSYQSATIYARNDFQTVLAFSREFCSQIW